MIFKIIKNIKGGSSMRIKLTDEHIKAIYRGEDLIIDGEKWEYVDELEVEEDEDARYFSYVLKRPSDGKTFMINLAQARYGYKDYGYEDWMQDFTAYEVEQKEIKKVEWVYVD